MKKYSLAALGGTFDHFHKGHEKFLQYTFSLAERAIIGITTDKMASQKPFPQTIESFKKRKEGLKQCLQKHNLLEKTQLLPLNDIYGPTLQSDAIQALVVTRLTFPGARKINQKRVGLGFHQLPIHVCPLIKSNDGRYFSSARIRQGLLSRSGQVYCHLFKKPFLLTPRQRQKLQKPQGKLFTKNITRCLKRLIEQTMPVRIALVGDSVLNFFVKNKIAFNYATIDWRINRQPATKTFYKGPFFATLKNPPGQLNPNTGPTIFRLVKNREKGVIKILGEEDLTVLTFILCLPLNSLVIYGQPQKGCVSIPVDEKNKEKFALYFSN